MQTYNNEIETAKCLHYATGFPVCVLRGEKVVYSLPEKILTAAELTGSEMLRLRPSQITRTVEYILSPAGERYICLSIALSTVLTLGPFLTEAINDTFITELVRSGLVKMHFRQELRRYFDSLEVISLQRYYYTGKLVEMLLAKNAVTEPNKTDSRTTPEFIPNAYYTQAKTYRDRQFLHSPFIMEQEISHYISIGDSEGALRTLAEINARPKARLAGTELRSLKNSVICSCAFMTRAAIMGGVSADGAFTLSDAYIQQIEGCVDTRSVLQFEEKMVIGFTAAVKDKKLGSFSPAISRAMGYIEDHLCEPLSLEIIADAAFLNPNYLSGLFNREVGETMHRYILRRRIEESSYYVRYGSEPLAEIASFFQFSSQSHFVRCFRQIIKQTPGAYRKNDSVPESPQ